MSDVFTDLVGQDYAVTLLRAAAAEAPRRAPACPRAR